MKGGHSRQKVGLVICKSRLVLGVGMTRDYFMIMRNSAVHIIVERSRDGEK